MSSARRPSPRLVLAIAACAALVTTALGPAAQAIDVDAARDDVAELAREIDAASVEYDRVEAELDAQGGRVAAAQAMAAAQAVAVRSTEQQLATLAVEAFKRGGVDPQLASIVDGGRYSASTRTLTLLAERRSVTLADLRTATTDLERAQAVAAQELDRVVALQAELAERRTDIEERLAEAQDVLAVAEAEELDRIAAEEARAERQASRGVRPAGPAVVLPPETGGRLTTPVGGRQSAFGYRTHPVYGDVRFHSGMDIISDCGVPVVAAADGVVESADWGGGYGNILVLTHGDAGGRPLSTAYAHLSDFAVTSGPVARGDVIGFVGTTGLSTGCHLHFEVRVSGEAVDPAGYL